MPRFYFNVITGDGQREDQEGSDLPDLQRARLEAINDARHLMSNAILDGEDVSSRHIEIRDQSGEVLLRVPFTDAFTKVV